MKILLSSEFTGGQGLASRLRTQALSQCGLCDMSVIVVLL